MGVVVKSKVDIAFEPVDLAGTRYRGWIADRMAINVEKRLLTLDLDMILEPFLNRRASNGGPGNTSASSCTRQPTRGCSPGRPPQDAHGLRASRLIDTQLPNGYLGTYKESDQFGQGDGTGWNSPVWDVWTHKYVLIGLLTYYRATGHGPHSRRAGALRTCCMNCSL